MRTTVPKCGDSVTEGTWLDIGCRSGGIASELAPKAHRIVGIDSEHWPSWAEMAGAQSSLSFMTGGFDGEELPVPERLAEDAVCNQVYEHAADPAALTRSIGRVLTPEGVCYSAGPNLPWPIEPHVYWSLVHWLPRNVAHRAMARLGARRPEDIDAYSAHVRNLRRWIRGVGLEWVDIVPMRTPVELRLRGHGRLAAMIDRLPAQVWMPFRPWWPGFVFILQRRRSRSDNA